MRRAVTFKLHPTGANVRAGESSSMDNAMESTVHNSSSSPQSKQLGNKQQQLKDQHKRPPMYSAPQKNPTALPSSSSSSASSPPEEAWRKHGKLFRAQLVVEDEEKGGNTSCSAMIATSIVSEKVFDQFLSANIDTTAELCDSYLVGSRLVKFLSVVLPTHKDYFHPNIATSRNKSQAQLVELLQCMEELALLIDKAKYENYILQDLSLDQTMVSGLTVSTSASSETQLTQEQDAVTNRVEDAPRGALEQQQQQQHQQQDSHDEDDPFQVPNADQSIAGASTRSHIDLLLLDDDDDDDDDSNDVANRSPNHKQQQQRRHKASSSPSNSQRSDFTTRIEKRWHSAAATMNVPSDHLVDWSTISTKQQDADGAPTNRQLMASTSFRSSLDGSTIETNSLVHHPVNHDVEEAVANADSPNISRVVYSVCLIDERVACVCMILMDDG
eukprot:CAMPEP_0198135664 /NCGR_PEP_ID=MMETSP1442-20131203/60707_1 /TAXON_ID= /ORGANISM="Craspedostauros australis, Strain CCMP3328" /LENGTH=442 /DNA_ID=CAMNT_0043796841 /DNA_START=281 /DNA_END=1607 /DNA_ORIENTATION=-